MAISSVGVGSGLDLESLITNLIRAERTPRETSLSKKETGIKAEISAFGTLRSNLSAFAKTLAALKESTSFDVFSSSVSDESALSVSADSSAVPGSYRIDVLNLAQSQSVRSNSSFTSSSDTAGSGILQFTNVSGDTFTVDTTDGKDTLADLRDKINSNAGNFGVTASLVTVAIDPNDISAGTKTELVLTSEKTGTENAFEITQLSGDANLARFTYALDGSGALVVDREAEDAKVQLDEAGTLFALSSSNSFENVISGVKFTALKVTDPGSPVTLETTLDSDGAKQKVQDFVDAYNTLQQTIRKNSNFDTNTETPGPFSGDFTVRGLQTSLQRAIGRLYSNGGDYETLASLGITTNRDGTLELDSSKLDSAINNNREDLTALFSGASGFIEQLETSLDPYTRSNSLIKNREDGLNSQLDRIVDQRDQLDLRMERLEKLYRDRFTALDTLVSSLQSTGSYLATQLANVSKINGG